MNLTQHSFDELIETQKKLVETLNHRMSSIEINVATMTTNVSWIKKIIFVGMTLLTGIFITLISIILKGII